MDLDPAADWVPKQAGVVSGITRLARHDRVLAPPRPAWHADPSLAAPCRRPAQVVNQARGPKRFEPAGPTNLARAATFPEPIRRTEPNRDPALGTWGLPVFVTRTTPTGTAGIGTTTGYDLGIMGQWPGFRWAL